MTKKITIVTNDDDWVGLYVDGKIVMQNHSLRVGDALEALGFDVKVVTCDHDWLFDQAYLPDDITDVVVDE